MEIILNALVGALANLGQTAVKDAYLAVKKLICNKYGDKSKLAEAVVELEESPDSAGRRAKLAEELTAAKADQDDSVVKAVQDLIAKIQGLPGVPQQIQQTVNGNRNIFSGSGNVTVTFDGKQK